MANYTDSCKRGQAKRKYRNLFFLNGSSCLSLAATVTETVATVKEVRTGTRVCGQERRVHKEGSTEGYKEPPEEKLQDQVTRVPKNHQPFRVKVARHSGPERYVTVH